MSHLTARACRELEVLFQRGEAAKGNKASAMQMEKRRNALGVQHRAERFACQNWLSGRLKQKADATDDVKVRARAEEEVRTKLHCDMTHGASHLQQRSSDTATSARC